MTQRSKTVSNRIKRMYAKMAFVAENRALDKIKRDEPIEAETLAKWAEDWFDRAGAQATQWYT